MAYPECLKYLEEATVLLAKTYLDYGKHNDTDVEQFLLRSYGEWNMGIEPETFDEWLDMITKEEPENATVEMPKLSP